MENNCLFCRIAAREIPAQIVYEDEHVLGFKDINPQAPIHILFVPREHIPSLAEADEQHTELLGRVVLAARKVAADLGLEDGYRVVNNCGVPAGQTVFHIHFHLLGGRDFSWPPG